jgi:hypothetical protein
MRIRSLVLLVASPICLAACDPVIDDRVSVEGARHLDDSIDPAPNLDATSAQRFPMPSQTGSAGPLKWDLPDGWVAQEAGSMRIADFRIGSNGATECYLSHLPGAAGGMEANVNRWRKQLGLEPMGTDDLAALPTIEMLGAPATLIDFSGTYKGMRDPTPKPGSRMLGAVLSLGELSLFAKMVGPEDVVAGERDAFVNFCRSIKFNREGAPAP